MSIKVQLSPDSGHAKVGADNLSATDIDKLIRDLAAARARMTPVHPAEPPADPAKLHQSDNLLWSVKALPEKFSIQFALQHPGLGWIGHGAVARPGRGFDHQFRVRAGEDSGGRMRAVALALFLAIAGTARADPVEDFYRGKTVTILVGFTAGGGYDLYARLLGRHIGKHIPGNPTVVVQNMPGAGSMKAVQYVYGVAAKDGLTLATVSRGMVTEPLLNGANFDPVKLTWLGTITSETSVCATWKTSLVKNWDDMFKREFSLGGSAVGADPDTFALIMRNVFGAKVKLVTGYPGGNDINLAMERQEVDGRCGWSWTSLKSQKQWLPQVNLLVQFNLEKNPDLPDVPVALERARDNEQRQVLRLLIAGQYVGRPFFTAPDIPAERKAALRAAFDATMKDQQFLAEAAKADLEISPILAGPIDAFLAELYRTPKAVVGKAVAAIQK